MEQIAAPLPILNTVIETSRPVEFVHNPQPLATTDATRAWMLLNEITIPEDAPIHSLLKPSALTAIDLLRTRLLRQMRREKLTRLALTSPRAGCGVAALATQLALSAARQSELKVMLLDLDMREPSIARILGVASEAPIRPALRGTRREFDSTAMRVGQNLALSLATEETTSPAELLAAMRSHALIDQIERDFRPDLLLLTLPPVLGQDDVVAAADLYDAALLIARADHTKVNEADTAEALISEQKPCLGVVLNGCRFEESYGIG
jgi:Mrp family chromosome partitioning ATPase